MPKREPVVLAGETYSLRMIGPQSQVWPDSPGSLYTVLANTSMVARPLPASNLPSSPDWVSGSYTARLGDSGEATLLFPNTTNSKGMLWRDVFASLLNNPAVYGHNQFLEITRNGELEFCGVIDQVPTIDGQQVRVHCSDGWFLLKKAYERDWIVTQAPRDVIDRGTQLWVPVVADNFAPGSLSTQWQTVQQLGGTVAVGNNGGCVLSVPASAGTGSSMYRGPHTGSNNASSGSLAWAYTGSIFYKDGAAANCYNPSTSSSAYSNYLCATNFRFDIPTGATITGVSATYYRWGTATADSAIKLIVGGAITGTNQSAGAFWFGSQSAPDVATFGGSSNLWGTSPTVAQVNASDFGVALQAKIGTDYSCYVDYVSLTVYYTAPAGSQPEAGVQSQTSTVAASGAWSAACSISTSTLNGNDGVSLEVTESTGDTYALTFYASSAPTTFAVNSTTIAQGVAASGTTYSILLESDGGWVWAFLNGALVGCVRRPHATTTSVQVSITLASAVSGTAATATITNAVSRVLQPFLMAGTDKGDYVLPGDASTYPVGGLHARYFNDNDLQSDGQAINKILAPTRTNGYLGSGGPEYMEQQDPQIDAQFAPGFTQTSPGPGGSLQSNWSCVWFGAIYLKLSAGNYTMQLQGPSQGPFAVRVWIGKTKLGDQLVDQWAWNAASSTYTFTVSASALAGSLPYGAGTVQRDGWYPIKVEYAVEGTACPAPHLEFTNVPAAYTDPGGTSITSGAQTTVVPSTSLSALGCVDQRYQGVSHFDLVQQTGQAYGYQLSVEPKQLESGLFPGVLAPRIREGHDTDLTLKPDTGPRQDGEGIINYSSGLDATDFASSLWGNGAGFQNGNTGQLQANVFDPATMLNSLFDVQQWTDFADASYSSLLHALLNSQLALQLEPWQLLSADPNGRPRQSYTWPLTGALAKMLWRPGDGLRIHARDINVWDTTPRQMLTVTRNILPNGVASTQAAFALRPRTPAHVLKQVAYKATRWSRNYQRQRVTLSGQYIQAQSIASNAAGTDSVVALHPGDTIVGAWLRVTNNSASQSFKVVVNGTDQTTTLGGQWTTVPFSLSLMPVAGPAQGQALAQMAVHLVNSGASTSAFSYQLYVDVLR